MYKKDPQEEGSRQKRIYHSSCITFVLEWPTRGGRQTSEDLASYLHKDCIRKARKSRTAHKGGLSIKRKAHNEDCIRKAHKRRKADKRGFSIVFAQGLFFECPTRGGRLTIVELASYLHKDCITKARKSRKAHKGGLCITRKAHNKDCIRKAHKRRKADKRGISIVFA